jgi:hypothetical protein
MGMFLVHINCSACPEEDEIVVDDLDELFGLGCECGYGFVIESVSEVELVERAGGTVVHFRRDPADLRRAA